MEKYYVLMSGSQVRFVITMGHYGKTLKVIMDLYDEARKDFPSLGMDKVDVMHYGGNRISGYMGIEFTLDWSKDHVIPKSWSQRNQLELTR